MISPRSVFARASAGLPGSFWWLWAGTLASSLATFVFPFLALFLVSSGFEVEQAGLMVALFGGGSILASPVAGFFADHLGRRPTLVLSLAATGMATAALALFSTPAAIAISVLVLGVVTNAFRPALNAMVTDLVDVAHRPRAFGLVYWAVNLGMGLSLLAGGALAAHGYRMLFLADAATTLVFAGLVWLNVPETHPGTRGEVARESSARGYGDVLRDRVFLAFLTVNFVFLLAFWQFQVALPIDMARRGLGPAEFGRALAVNGLLIATLQPFSAALTRRFDAAYVLATASLLVGVGYGAYAFCSTVAEYAAATAVWTVGEILALPVAAALVADLSPVDLRGRYQGAFGVSFGIAMFVSPILGAAALQRLGPGPLWTGCFAAAFVAALGHLAIAGPRRRAIAERAAFR